MKKYIMYISICNFDVYKLKIQQDISLIKEIKWIPFELILCNR